MSEEVIEDTVTEDVESDDLRESLAAQFDAAEVEEPAAPEETPEAHHYLAENKNFGKVLLLWD